MQKIHKSPISRIRTHQADARDIDLRAYGHKKGDLKKDGANIKLFHEEFPEIEDILNYSMDALTQKKFKKLTITTGGRTKASITFSKDTIKVEREDKSTYTRETEV